MKKNDKEKINKEYVNFVATIMVVTSIFWFLTKWIIIIFIVSSLLKILHP